jgi:hypothetical protein
LFIFLDVRFPLSIFCIAGLVVIKSFSLLGKVFISTSTMKYSFAGFSNLGWQLFSFRVWSTSLHALLAFRVFAEKSAFIWWVCLYRWLGAYVFQLSLFCLFCISNVLTITFGKFSTINLLTMSSMSLSLPSVFWSSLFVRLST